MVKPTNSAPEKKPKATRPRIVMRLTRGVRPATPEPTHAELEVLSFIAGFLKGLEEYSSNFPK
jgi:hypothetical protein